MHVYCCTTKPAVKSVLDCPSSGTRNLSLCHKFLCEFFLIRETWNELEHCSILDAVQSMAVFIFHVFFVYFCHLMQIKQ